LVKRLFVFFYLFHFLNFLFYFVLLDFGQIIWVYTIFLFVISALRLLYLGIIKDAHVQSLFFLLDLLLLLMLSLCLSQLFIETSNTYFFYNTFLFSAFLPLLIYPWACISDKRAILHKRSISNKGSIWDGMHLFFRSS